MNWVFAANLNDIQSGKELIKKRLAKCKKYTNAMLQNLTDMVTFKVCLSNIRSKKDITVDLTGTSQQGYLPNLIGDPRELKPTIIRFVFRCVNALPMRHFITLYRDNADLYVFCRDNR